jgi:protein gp37
MGMETTGAPSSTIRPSESSLPTKIVSADKTVQRRESVAANSAIEWTDKTWQVTAGCLHRSPGCGNCYAEMMAYRLACMALADIKAGRDPGGKRKYLDVIDMETGKWNGRVIPVPDALEAPHRWRKPSMVFVDSMSDLFFGDDWDRKACEKASIPFSSVPEEFIESAFGVMSLTPRHTYQVLTKRDGRALDVIRSIYKRWKHNDQQDEDLAAHRCQPSHKKTLIPLPNVWVGCSAESQKEAICRHRSLTDIPAAVRFWSLEPLLGPIDALPLKNIGWVIVGGESGHGARECNINWIRSIVAQCQAASVPCFVKQLGSKPIDEFQTDDVGSMLFPGGKPKGLKVEGQYYHRRPVTLEHSKGGEMSEWPEDLRIREFPKVLATA